MEEHYLLQLLESGELDGNVGETRTYRKYRSFISGRCIKDGIPIIFREGRIGTSLQGSEREDDPIIREEEKCLTPDSKLAFLQKFGWLTNNERVRNYSKKYKPVKVERKLK